MVDTEDIFRRLTSGARFNREKLKTELAFLRGGGGIGQEEEERRGKQHSVAAALDFFGDLTTTTPLPPWGNTPSVTMEPQSPEATATEQDERIKQRKKRKRKMDRRRCEKDEELAEGFLSIDDEEEEERAETGMAVEFSERTVGGEEEEESGVEEEEEGVGGGEDGKEIEEVEEVEEEEEKGSDSEAEIEVLRGVPVSRKRRRRKQKIKNIKTEKEKQSLLKREKANAFRKAHKIYVSGADVPDPVSSFSDLYHHYSLPAYLQRNITAAGYFEPTPIQMQTIPLMLHGREVLACAPTGSGKTAAFIIPLLVHLKEPAKVGFRALIISPTRELAQQTYRECSRLSLGSGFKVHVLTKAKASANSFGPSSSQRFDILVTTPSRLVYMLSQEPPAIQLNSVEWLVLDEADKLFEDGPNDSGFRNQVAQIYSACDNPNVKHALFSATLGSGVEEFSHTYFTTPVRVIVGLKNTATDAVKQELLFVGQESGKLLAIRNIVKKGFTPPLLVFIQSKERAKELFHELIYDGLNVEVIHADRTQAQRDNIIKSFRAGRIWILICTDLMGRGMDFKGVNMVINYDFPSSAITYIHRIGRTGRAGRQGQAVTFFTEDDAVNLRSIADMMRASGCEVPDWMLKIKKPSKSMKKKLAHRPLKREGIRTTTRYDLQRAKKKKDIIVASKKTHKKLSSHGVKVDQNS